jgi:hypothetical protein
MYHSTTKCTKLPQHVPTFAIPRPSKIYPNSDFWFENIPSGNPGGEPKLTVMEDLAKSATGKIGFRGKKEESKKKQKKEKKKVEILWN